MTNSVDVKSHDNAITDQNTPNVNPNDTNNINDINPNDDTKRIQHLLHNHTHNHNANDPHSKLELFTSNEPFQSLSDEEIEKFFKEIDINNDGYITFQELEKRLEKVYKELVPKPKKHHLHHPDRLKNLNNILKLKSTTSNNNNNKNNNKNNETKAKNNDKIDQVLGSNSDLHDFLWQIMPNCSEKIPKNEFINHVKSWNIPSQKQNSAEDELKNAQNYRNNLTLSRKLKAYWSMFGPKILFIGFVIALQISIGLWQLIIYVKNSTARSALGWGVIVSKGSAGVLYPTLFFMILSMSRWFAIYCRKSYYISRIINWDRHQSFHIWMACIALFFASLHGIGHLTGTFLYGSRPAQEESLAILLGPGQSPKTYKNFIKSLPGWSGITTLSMFWIIAILSEPHIKKWSYELFQLGHLLMFPMIILLSIHGTAKLLQYPMLGFWLIIPSLLVIFERLHRLYRGFIRIPTKIELPDSETVILTCYKPNGTSWRYTAGQYIFLQVPEISFFQWHPFTISTCRGNILQLHIKTDGNWTSKLRELGNKGSTSKDAEKDFENNIDNFSEIHVGIDGPFGAPAQRFYEYDRALIIGAGVGVTPFSAIIADLETNLSNDEDPWARRRSNGSIAFGSKRNSVSSRMKDQIQHQSQHDIKPDHKHEPESKSVSEQESKQKIDDNISSSSLNEDIKINNNNDNNNNNNNNNNNINNDNNDASKDFITFKDDNHNNHKVRRRVDFHWLVREKNHLLWFSSLLNRAHDLSEEHKDDENKTFDLNILTHVTLKRQNISQHIFRYLLDAYRSSTQPVSALTGLKVKSQFGRPDFEDILNRFYDDIIEEIKLSGDKSQQKIGVFYCGPAVIGEVLSDICHELTQRASAEDLKMRWDFRIEVFG